MNVREIFDKLKSEYGSQKWWPIYVVDPDLNKFRMEHGLTYGIPYKEMKRFYNDFRDPYFEIAIGAILAQNVSWANAAKAVDNLYQKGLLKPELLLKARTSDLKKLLISTRYYTQKEKSLKMFSDWIIRDLKGDVLNSKKASIKLGNRGGDRRLDHALCS